MIFARYKVYKGFVSLFYNKMLSTFKIARTHPDAIVPKRATTGSAGYDLHAVENVLIPARTWKAIETGIMVQCPSDHYVRIAPRSGLAYKSGVAVMAGVVDSDYTGTIKAILYNSSNENFAVNQGERIAQLVFERISTPDLVEVAPGDITATERGAGGFGSTGC
jgi:dUTP pyrophosphatase